MIGVVSIYIIGCFAYFVAWTDNAGSYRTDVRLTLFWIWPLLFAKFVVECITSIVWFLLKNFVKDFWYTLKPSQWFADFRR